LGVHLFLAVFGIANKGSGVGGWLGDENDFCMEMNVAIPFAYFSFQSAKIKIEKMFYVGVLSMCVLAGMISLSRGGFIGLAVVGTYCWLRSSKKVGAILLIGVVIIFMIIFAPEEYWEEIQSITSDQTAETGTGGERLYSWGIGWDMFLNNPILGLGQGNYPWNVGDYEAGRTFNTRSLAGRQAHSAYFTLLPELGLVGVCIFFAFLYAIYKDMQLVRGISQSLLRRLDGGKDHDDLIFTSNLARAIEGSVMGYLASSVFISTLYYPSFWTLTAFAVVLRNATIGRFGHLEMNLPSSVQYPSFTRVPLSVHSGRRTTGGTGPVVT
jgi:O-antigen ligase